MGFRLLTSGTAFVAPFGVTLLHVYCVGDGGNGADGVPSGAGGGGGGGEFRAETLTVTPLTSYTYQIGVPASPKNTWFSLDGGATHAVEASGGANGTGIVGGTRGTGGTGTLYAKDGGDGGDALSGVGSRGGGGGGESGTYLNVGQRGFDGTDPTGGAGGDNAGEVFPVSDTGVPFTPGGGAGGNAGGNPGIAGAIYGNGGGGGGGDAAGGVGESGVILAFWSDAAVTLADNGYGNSGCQTAQSTYSFSVVSQGANRFILVGVSLLSVAGASVNSVTFNGDALTLIRARASAVGAIRGELWGLIAPDVGTFDVVVTLSASLISVATATVFEGVDQLSPYESTGDTSATNVGAADATQDVVPTTDNCVIVDLIATTDTAITVGTGQTGLANVTCTGSGGMSVKGPISPAGSTTMYWTDVGAAETWVVVGLAVRPAVVSSVADWFQQSPRVHPAELVAVGYR